jgi:hypothetical protein
MYGQGRGVPSNPVRDTGATKSAPGWPPHFPVYNYRRERNRGHVTNVTVMNLSTYLRVGVPAINAALAIFLGLYLLSNRNSPSFRRGGIVFPDRLRDAREHSDRAAHSAANRDRPPMKHRFPRPPCAKFVFAMRALASPVLFAINHLR